jgi:hypothetical protein
MHAPTRRHRASDTPVGRERIIAAADINGPYLEVLRCLDPYLHFKYATIPWLHYLSGATVEYSVFRKYLGYMRAAPNHYIDCPDQQLASPNADRKTLVYELRERGLNLLIERRIVDRRTSPEPAAKVPKSQRNHAFALHRSNSYYHEMIVDLGYHAPLRYLADHDPALRLIGFPELLAHHNVPAATRETNDPLLIHLRNAQLRFDGTPHVIVRKRADGVFALGIPGIQVDRGTESFDQVETYIEHAIEFVEDHHYERHWGFDNCVIPFLFTKDLRKNRAVQFVRARRGTCQFLLFQTVPDYGLLRHFPRPEHYDRAYHYQDGDVQHPDTIHVFTNPWQRAGCPDFFLNTFDETGGV